MSQRFSRDQSRLPFPARVGQLTRAVFANGVPSGRRRFCNGGLLLLLVASPCGSSVTAMETDQFLALDLELEDSAEPLNDHVHAVFEQRLAMLNARRSVPERERMTCDRVVGFVYEGFRRRLYSKVAEWAHSAPEIDRYPDPQTGRLAYFRQSVVGVPYYARLGLPLARTLDVNGVRLGTDKLGHFFSYGIRYYRRHLDNLERGLTADESTREIVGWGLQREKTYDGLYMSGILSFADLEANYQGFRLVHSLCDGSGTMRLALDESSNWTLLGRVDVRDYANPDWDESFNPSFYKARKWKRVRPRLERHCAKMEGPQAIRRFAHYREVYEPSESARIIQQLLIDEPYPSPRVFSLQTVCGPSGEDFAQGTTSDAAAHASQP